MVTTVLHAQQILHWSKVTAYVLLGITFIIILVCRAAADVKYALILQIARFVPVHCYCRIITVLPNAQKAMQDHQVYVFAAQLDAWDVLST